jgi:c-di-GMP-binding flagellar brake protein YcgR
MVARYVDAQGPPLGAAPNWDADERRRSSRVDATIRATVRSSDGADGVPTRARAVDISEYGAKLMLRRRYETGSRVTVDLECELPLRVHLGYDADSLVIDGPMHTHMVRLEARVVRCIRASDRLWDVGLEFHADTPIHERHVVHGFVEHLRDNEAWMI